QAEDGIRDWSVTGVQTCALPISVPQGASDRWKAGAREHQLSSDLMRLVERCTGASERIREIGGDGPTVFSGGSGDGGIELRRFRSEERRVGKEVREREAPTGVDE